MIHLTLAKRHLLGAEALLSELDSALAREAIKLIHSARLNVETMQRLQEHSKHVVGERGEAA